MTDYGRGSSFQTRGTPSVAHAIASALFDIDQNEEIYFTYIAAPQQSDHACIAMSVAESYSCLETSVLL
jgi:hypothetical protein